MSFTVAIVGRPNVGKSTLFNRLVGRRLALVDDRPGVTRDRREGRARLGDLAFSVIDTAGLEEAAPESLTGRMQEQTEAALASAECGAVRSTPAPAGPPVDRAFADLGAPMGKPAIGGRKRARAGRPKRWLKAYELGLGSPVAVSAEHGEGLAISTKRCARHCPRRPRPKDIERRDGQRDDETGEAVQSPIPALTIASFVVALIAAAAGVLSLTSAKVGGLSGVFISVTTVPAAGNVALGIAFGATGELRGSSIQLLLNIGGMVLAGWATLALQQLVWRRMARHRRRDLARQHP